MNCNKNNNIQNFTLNKSRAFQRHHSLTSIDSSFNNILKSCWIDPTFVPKSFATWSEEKKTRWLKSLTWFSVRFFGKQGFLFNKFSTVRLLKHSFVTKNQIFKPQTFGFPRFDALHWASRRKGDFLPTALHTQFSTSKEVSLFLYLMKSTCYGSSDQRMRIFHKRVKCGS